MRTIKYILILLCYFISSCNYIPCGWSSDLSIVKEMPSVESLIGVYKPDDITKQILPGYFDKSSTITLEKDSILKFKYLPKSLVHFTLENTKDDSLVNGTGKWFPTYSIIDKIAEISLTIKSNTTPTEHLTSYWIYKKNNQHVIFIVVGDPDECRAARFVQQTQ